MNTPHGIPALLSFLFPGLGQFIKRHPRKAGTIWFMLAILLLILYMRILPLYVYALSYAILLVWNVNDAYNSNDPDKF